MTTTIITSYVNKLENAPICQHKLFSSFTCILFHQGVSSSIANVRADESYQDFLCLFSLFNFILWF